MQHARIQLKILIADDDPKQLGVLKEHLENARHRVFCASNGEEALRIATEIKPELVITACEMPEIDGIEFCKLLRNTPFGRTIYVIILTTCEQDDILVASFDAGVDDYLVKPLNHKRLFARMRAAERIILLQQELFQEREALRKLNSTLASTNLRLQELALTDSLTALPNRRYAFDRLEQEWEAASRYGFPLSCLLIDIDHFKQVNDRCGHDVGDLVLRETSQVLREAARKNDVVCRLGGEEFLIICSNNDLRSAEMFGERLRTAVSENDFKDTGFVDRITVSVGVATREDEMDSVSALVKAADEAVYRAKETGRDCVCSTLAGELIKI